MTDNKADLLLHPIRLRIVMALAGEELTTAGIGGRVPDVPQATLYRQVATLAEAGLLEVVGEEKKRGGVERTYRVVAGAAGIGPEEAAAMTTEEHMNGFVTFVGALVDSFARYLDHEKSEPSQDAVGYRQAALWLSPDDAVKLAKAIGDLVDPFLERSDAAGKERILFNTILIPDVSVGD